MKPEYIKEMRNTYLKLDGDNTSEFQMKMVLNNRIKGLLPVSVRQMNDREYYLYHMNGTLSLTEYFSEKHMESGDLQMFVTSVQALAGELELYLLNTDALILNPDMIFIDLTEGQWLFCYHTGISQGFDMGLRQLFEFIIQKVDHTDSEAVTFAYGIYKRISMGQTGTLELLSVYRGPEVRQCEITEKSTPVETIIPEIVEEETEVQDGRKLFGIYAGGAVLIFFILFFLLGTFLPPLRLFGMPSYAMAAVSLVCAAVLFITGKKVLANPDFLSTIQTQERIIPFTKDEVEIRMPKSTAQQEKEELTVVLNHTAVTGNHELRWQDGVANFHYPLQGNSIIIGSAKDKSDCVISVQGISRMHARITREGSSYFIKDLNSTNGTAVNGRSLNCFELCEIHSMDSIQLGGVTCVFV